jgi:hypothetical protein
MVVVVGKVVGVLGALKCRGVQGQRGRGIGRDRGTGRGRGGCGDVKVGRDECGVTAIVTFEVAVALFARGGACDLSFRSLILRGARFVWIIETQLGDEWSSAVAAVAVIIAMVVAVVV